MPNPAGAEAISAFIFLLFIIGTLGAIVLRDYSLVRKSYISLFFASLLLANLVAPVPFVHLQKFSTAADDQIQFHEVRVADEHGEEIIYDARATAHFEERQMQILGEAMATEYTDDEAERAGQHLLERAQIYRTEVEHGQSYASVLELPRFPRHTIDYQWSSEQVNSIGEFYTIRVYHVTVMSDGYDNIQIINETKQIEIGDEM